MPKLSEIAFFWSELDDLAEFFPNLACFGADWGEPFCFRCGWLAPNKEAGSYPAKWPAERAITFAWEGASGWLEKAHLHDHAFGGSVEPENLVPLCVLCHEQQPICETRDEGIEFVRSPAPHRHIRRMLQLGTDESGKGIRRPGKERALRHMLRAGLVVAIAGEQTVREMDS